MSECVPEWMCQHQPVTGPPLPDLLVDQIWLMVLRDQLINSMFFGFQREMQREAAVIQTETSQRQEEQAAGRLWSGRECHKSDCRP